MALASLRFWNDRFIWTSPAHRGGRTSRPSIALLIGAWGELRVQHDAGEISSRAIAVNSGTQRSIDARQGFYSFNLDPIHPLCKKLRATLFARDAVVDLQDGMSAGLLDSISAEIRQPSDCTRALALSKRVLQALFADWCDCPPLDPRVTDAALWLRHNLPTRDCLSVLAERSGLSASRLSHLFRDEMGVTIKSYLLAMKMRQAAQWFGQDRSLTEIAHMMGFSDSPHLSKAFQAYFSVPPSLLTNRDVVQVCSCEAT